jgi:hypothetical protein
MPIPTARPKDVSKVSVITNVTIIVKKSFLLWIHASIISLGAMMLVTATKIIPTEQMGTQ